MGNSRIEFLENSYYHVYNAGFSDEPLFHVDSEYRRFYDLLLRYLKEYPNIKLVSYSLLPDHFHLVVKNMKTGYDLSDFMKKLQGAYATWYRRYYKSEFKHPVFKGRFKSERLQDEEYLYKVLSFVNYNPLKHGVVTDIKSYEFTSLHKLQRTGPKPFLMNQELDLDELEYLN